MVLSNKSHWYFLVVRRKKLSVKYSADNIMIISNNHHYHTKDKQTPLSWHYTMNIALDFLFCTKNLKVSLNHKCCFKLLDENQTARPDHCWDGPKLTCDLASLIFVMAVGKKFMICERLGQLNLCISLFLSDTYTSPNLHGMGMFHHIARLEHICLPVLPKS